MEVLQRKKRQKIRKQLRLPPLGIESFIHYPHGSFVCEISDFSCNSMARSSQPLILKSLGADESLMGTVMAVQFDSAVLLTHFYYPR